MRLKKGFSTGFNVAFKVSVWLVLTKCALAAVPVQSTCREFMAPKKSVNGKTVGQEDCLMQEFAFSNEGRNYRRFDIGITGTLSGWAVKEGARAAHFTPGPEFLFPQSGNNFRRFHGILRYEASKGISMTLVYPEGPEQWNGKLYLHVHGGGGSFREGTLKPWYENLDPSNPLGDFGKYERSMLEKGYAVTKTRRNASDLGDYSVVLDSGEITGEKNVCDHPELLLDMAKLAKNVLAERLGKRPTRTYWYGHSAGVMVGRLINYIEGMNVDEDGGQIIDGFLFDDPGGGLWLPVLMKDGKDVLFTTAQERKRFVKTIEVAHQLYPNFYRDPSVRMSVKEIPEWVSPVYLMNKRKTAALMRQKGLEDRYRMYEVRDVSHSGGDGLADGKRGDVEILNLSRLIDGIIDLLDQWVENNKVPPPTKSDLLELGDLDEDGRNENPAISLPEGACPLGVYYPFPPSLSSSGVGRTSFAAFDGKSLEPIDGRGAFVDMNLNRYFDYRETVTQAWRRLNLLKPEENFKFSREHYVRCVSSVTSKLKSENLITDKVATAYVQEASEKELPQE